MAQALGRVAVPLLRMASDTQAVLLFGPLGEGHEIAGSIRPNGYRQVFLAAGHAGSIQDHLVAAEAAGSAVPFSEIWLTATRLGHAATVHNAKRSLPAPS